MKRREKILAAALVIAIVAWFGLSAVRGIILGPLDERSNRLSALDATANRLQTQEDQVLAAKRQMKKWRDRSLPPDPLEAQRLYQEWLTDLAQMCGFTALRVSPEQLQATNLVFKEVRVTLNAEASMEQLTSFLHYFRRIDLLHRIAGLKVEAPTNPGGTFKVSVSAEGLCLPDATPRTYLFPRTQLADSLPRSFDTMTVNSTKDLPEKPGFAAKIDDEFVKVTKINGKEWTLKRGIDGTAVARHAAKADVELYPLRSEEADVTLEDVKKSLAAHPFFIPKQAVVVDPNDAAGQTKLMATSTIESDRSALLGNVSNRTRTRVQKGSAISISDVQGTVVSVEPTFITIDRKGETWQLDMGENLRSMRRIGGGGDEGAFGEGLEPGGMPAGGRGRSFGRGGRGGPDRGSRGGSERGRGGFGRGSRGRGGFGRGGPDRNRPNRADSESSGGDPAAPKTTPGTGGESSKRSSSPPADSVAVPSTGDVSPTPLPAESPADSKR